MSQTPKPYPEVIVFAIACLIAAVLLIFVHYRDVNGMDRYCRNHVGHCDPAVYPGKVVTP